MSEEEPKCRTYRLTKKRAAVSLAAATSPFAAARELGIPDSTVRTWCHRDPELAPLYRAERVAALDALEMHSPDAVSVLHSVATDVDAVEPKDRVRAASALLTAWTKMRAAMPEEPREPAPTMADALALASDEELVAAVAEMRAEIRARDSARPD